MDENNITESTGSNETFIDTPEATEKKGINILIPYFIALGGAILAVVANFIPYIEISNFFFSRKVSVFSLITETLDNPDNMLGSTGDKVVFYLLIAAIVFSLLVVLFTGIKKMVPAIVFIILAALPFLMIGSAYIHYAGLVIALIGVIWYKVIASKQKKDA